MSVWGYRSFFGLFCGLQIQISVCVKGQPVGYKSVRELYVSLWLTFSVWVTCHAVSYRSVWITCHSVGYRSVCGLHVTLRITGQSVGYRSVCWLQISLYGWRWTLSWTHWVPSLNEKWSVYTVFACLCIGCCSLACLLNFLWVIFFRCVFYVFDYCQTQEVFFIVFLRGLGEHFFLCEWKTESDLNSWK